MEAVAAGAANGPRRRDGDVLPAAREHTEVQQAVAEEGCQFVAVDVTGVDGDAIVDDGKIDASGRRAHALPPKQAQQQTLVAAGAHAVVGAGGGRQSGAGRNGAQRARAHPVHTGALRGQRGRLDQQGRECSGRWRATCVRDHASSAVGSGQRVQLAADVGVRGSHGVALLVNQGAARGHRKIVGRGVGGRLQRAAGALADCHGLRAAAAHAGRIRAGGIRYGRCDVLGLGPAGTASFQRPRRGERARLRLDIRHRRARLSPDVDHAAARLAAGDGTGRATGQESAIENTGAAHCQRRQRDIAGPARDAAGRAVRAAARSATGVATAVMEAIVAPGLADANDGAAAEQVHAGGIDQAAVRTTAGHGLARHQRIAGCRAPIAGVDIHAGRAGVINAAFRQGRQVHHRCARGQRTRRAGRAAATAFAANGMGDARRPGAVQFQRGVGRAGQSRSRVGAAAPPAHGFRAAGSHAGGGEDQGCVGVAAVARIERQAAEAGLAVAAMTAIGARQTGHVAAGRRAAGIGAGRAALQRDAAIATRGARDGKDVASAGARARGAGSACARAADRHPGGATAVVSALAAVAAACDGFCGDGTAGTHRREPARGGAAGRARTARLGHRRPVARPRHFSDAVAAVAATAAGDGEPVESVAGGQAVVHAFADHAIAAGTGRLRARCTGGAVGANAHDLEGAGLAHGQRQQQRRQYSRQMQRHGIHRSPFNMKKLTDEILPELSIQ
uniref:Uncharacterized protein n=1 Tax=Tanacetum cinerariifolium TaxID=118510 RepID=A0A699GE23_TANCI|nr:hypothetical protein [Tanacetum cinerariifolium]